MVPKVLAAVCVCLLMLSGCSSASQPVSSDSPLAVVTPTGGRPLADVGFTNSIADSIWLPIGTRLTYTADQPNLLIAVGDLEQASFVEDFLRSSLPGLGWSITATSEGGLVFSMGQWQGGFVTGDTSWGLTVRDD